MKKLKNKIFWTIQIILSIFLLTILFIYNYQNYNREKTNIEQSLFRMKNEKFKRIFDNNIPSKLDEKDSNNRFTLNENPKRFMDVTIYTVLLNKDNSILEIISHTEDGEISENIRETTTKIIKENKESKTFIGNLYFSNYAYNYDSNNRLILIDTIDIRNNLTSLFKLSLLLLFLSEIIIIYVSNLLSKWIIKPVEISFNKQKEFIADASHELKTPLSVIIACSEALEEDVKEHKWIKTIRNESERMSKLITNLLDLAKIENETNKKIYEEINLSKSIEKSILSFESMIYERNIKLEYNINDNIMYKCNSDEMKQLISILIDNALKHSCEKGKIVIDLKSEKNIITLKVKNKGNPIPKGEEEKIFERFYRIDKSRNRNDNRYGLGLAIAKSIVINHNGKITAHSDKNYTTFTIVLKK